MCNETTNANRLDDMIRYRQTLQDMTLKAQEALGSSLAILSEPLMSGRRLQVTKK